MPMYDYRCDLCDIQFEVRQSFQDDALIVCPAVAAMPGCKKPGEGIVKKIFASVGIAFKGEGFYKNDHGSHAKSRRTEQEAAQANVDSKSKTKDKDASSDSSSSQNNKKDKEQTSSNKSHNSSKAETPDITS
ncbi:MAG: hypothetical protein OXI96_07185 [Acidimicrobiaceae bacterium]|nr:hypothetical protein [Acidimicrobiaceae bacterium]